MRVFVRVILVGVLLAALTLPACTVAKPQRPRYYIVVANRTKRWFDDVWVHFGNQIAAAPGRAIPSGEASYGPVTLPIPEEATVTWTEETGTHHAPKVKLAGLVPPSPRDMDIYFIIEEDDSVTVMIIRDGDLATNRSLGKTLSDVRNRPGAFNDLLVGARPIAGTDGRFVKGGGVGMAQSQFDVIVGNLPVTKHPDGSQSTTLPDGTKITVRARRPDGGFDPDMNAVGTIQATLPTGKEVEIRYQRE